MKFIRKNGRIIPIKEKGEASPKKNKNLKADKALVMKGLANEDRKLARTGNAVAGVSAIASAGLAYGAFKTKNSIMAGIAGVAGAFALLNKGFADGRTMSAKDGDKYASQLSKGKKIKRENGIGGASERQYRNAKYVEGAGSRKLNQLKGLLKIKGSSV